MIWTLQGRYRRLMGKLNYLRVTRANVAYPILVWWVNSYLLHRQVTRMLWFEYFGIWSVSLAWQRTLIFRLRSWH